MPSGPRPSPTAPWACSPAASSSAARRPGARRRPGLLLCDEPLTSLDLANQRDVIDLIDRYRTASGAGVLLVTHDINPVLEKVDRILYLAGGRFTLGAPTRS
jgi:ABC-type Mn2+/Zn2+ transport system ATPase subunit